MVTNSNNFANRLDRIQSQRQRRRGGMGFMVHPDGVVTAIGRPSSRLRFGFPLKGLVLAFLATVLVKAYVMWLLGPDAYAFEVSKLLDGSGFERAAAQLMMPDALTLWMVERYEAINLFIQGGLAAG